MVINMKKTVKILIIAMIAVLISCVPAFAANDGLNNDQYNGHAQSNASVSFFIQIDGEQLDSNGNVSARDKKFFTGSVGKTTLKSQLSQNFSIAVGNGVSESDILAYLSSTPDETTVFEDVVNQYKSKDAYIRSSNGKIIPWSRLTEDNYKIQWYVLKKEGDGWHVDGVIIDKETDKEISIVVPEEKAERTTCVEYDAQTGTFIPGVMSIKPNRPHSVWDGDNHTWIMDGFEDVWYTVLDEDTFEENSYVIPQDLIDAASAVYKLAGARLAELEPSLQSQYGRIDSQAYKQEYIARNGLRTLYITPFISERLLSKYGVDNDKYIWLAMGDTQGNIQKVYVMDRDAAGIDNMFDEE